MFTLKQDMKQLKGRLAFLDTSTYTNSETNNIFRSRHSNIAEKIKQAEDILTECKTEFDTLNQDVDKCFANIIDSLHTQLQ